MSKYEAGWLVVGGLLFGGFCVMIARGISMQEYSADMDSGKDILWGFAIVGAIGSAIAFCIGAANFTNAK